MLGFHIEVLYRDSTEEPSDLLPKPKSCSTKDLVCLWVRQFEQAESTVLVKDGRGDYDTRISRFLLQAGSGFEEKWPFQKKQPHVMEDQGETAVGRGERPPWFLPAPIWMWMQVRYEWGEMAWECWPGNKGCMGHPNQARASHC